MSKWYQLAACAEIGIEPFYDSGEMQAMKICGGCEVRKECLEAAVEEEKYDQYLYGVRGGTTAKQRAQMRVGNRVSRPRDWTESVSRPCCIQCGSERGKQSPITQLYCTSCRRGSLGNRHAG